MALYYGAQDLAESAYLRYGSPPPPPPPPIDLPPLDYLSVPRDLTLEHTWMSQSYFGNLQEDCAISLSRFPLQGEISSLKHPLLGTYGRCTIGLYFTEPKPNGNPMVEDKWANIQTWVMATIDLYLPFSATGFTLNFMSGIQVTVFDPWVVQYDPKRISKTRWVMESLKDILDDTLSGNKGRGRSRGQNRGRLSSGILPTATTITAAPVLSSFGTAITSAFFSGFADAAKPMASWAGQPKLDAEECKTAIFEAAMVTWYYSRAGLFFERPYIFNYERCAVGLSLTNPSTSGRPPFVSGVGANVEVMLLALMMHTVVDQSLPGYADLPNGVQIAFWDWQYLDPAMQCSKTKKLSLLKCLNVLATRKNKGLGSASVASGSMPGLSASVSLSIPLASLVPTLPSMPTVPTLPSVPLVPTLSSLLTLPGTTTSTLSSTSTAPNIAIILPYATGSQTGVQMLLQESGLAGNLG
ncbi:hypothetical protein MMC34_004697 [Xylographa carneopallida]|nr:hypothetical protein [Xylographa carneopallida]